MFVKCSYQEAVALWGEAAVSAVWMRMMGRDEERADDVDDGMGRDQDEVVEGVDFAREA